jgi:hypothetical protein
MLPATFSTTPADPVPVAVKLGVVVPDAPAAVPFAAIPSSDVPVLVLDCVQVTPPLAVPVKVAVAGGLGGDDHEVAIVLIEPFTVAVNVPQSAIAGGGGVLSGHAVTRRTLTITAAIKESLYICLSFSAGLG